MTSGDSQFVIKAIQGIIVGLALSYVTATTAWMFSQSATIAGLSAKVEAMGIRVSHLESGRTTPMAAETRAEFTAIWRELEKVRGRPQSK